MLKNFVVSVYNPLGAILKLKEVIERPVLGEPVAKQRHTFFSPLKI